MQLSMINQEITLFIQTILIFILSSDKMAKFNYSPKLLIKKL